MIDDDDDDDGDEDGDEDHPIESRIHARKQFDWPFCFAGAGGGGTIPT